MEQFVNLIQWKFRVVPFNYHYFCILGKQILYFVLWMFRNTLRVVFPATCITINVQCSGVRHIANTIQRHIKHFLLLFSFCLGVCH